MKSLDRNALDKWLSNNEFKNYVESSDWVAGNCTVVRRDEKEWRQDVRIIFPWLSENTVDSWSKFITGIYVFKSEEDAAHFKLRWG